MVKIDLPDFPWDSLADDTKLKTFRNRGGILEFIVYLACREHGVPVERAADQLGWQPGTVQNRAGEARRALGVRDDGEDWLPDAQRSPAALSRGVATYQLLPELLVDADLLRRLRLRPHARGPDGIEDLITALRLVEGEPFSQLRRNGYGWLVVLATGVLIGYVAGSAPARVQVGFAAALCWFLLLGGLRATRELRPRRGGASDADMLARLTHVPGAVWRVFFWLVAGAAVVAAGWLLLV